MEFIFEILGIKELNLLLRSRLILSLFCLLTFIVLIYFWSLTSKKSDINKANVSGLIFLSFVFFLYFVIGFSTVYSPSMNIYLSISGLINICFLLSLSFFSQGNSFIDKIVQHRFWKMVTIVLGIVWFLLNVWTRQLKMVQDIDAVVSAISIFLFGFYLSRTFVKKGLKLFGIITGLLIILIIWLQFNSPEVLGKGKFFHMNTTLLSPALFLSIISVSFTFNWVNEQNFRELSQIYTVHELGFFEEEIEQLDRSKELLSKRWQEQVTNDNLEKVIEEVLTYKKNKNESLGFIINIAQRNTRNNTNRLKELIKYEEYQLNRNKISTALISLIKGT